MYNWGLSFTLFSSLAETLWGGWLRRRASSVFRRPLSKLCETELWFFNHFGKIILGPKVIIYR